MVSKKSNGEKRWLFSIGNRVEIRPLEMGKKALEAVKSGWSIVYIEGSQVIISKKYFTVFLSLKIDFALCRQ